VFDSTAISSLNRFANRMQSGAFPPQRNWARLLPGPDIPEGKRAEVSRILDAYVAVCKPLINTQKNFIGFIAAVNSSFFI
jgi:hypothetical protein